MHVVPSVSGYNVRQSENSIRRWLRPRRTHQGKTRQALISDVEYLRAALSDELELLSPKRYANLCMTSLNKRNLEIGTIEPLMSKRNFKEIFQRHQGSSIDLLNQKTPQWNALRLLTSGLGSSNLVHLKSKSGLYGNGQEKSTTIFERGCSMVCLPSG